MLDTNDKILTGAVVTSGVVLGAIAAAFAIRRWPVRARADCSQVGPQGGVVAGVPYREQLRGGATPNEALPMVVLFHSLGAGVGGHTNMLTGIGRARLISPEGAYRVGDGGGRKWWERGVKDAALKDPDGAAVQWHGSSERIAEFLRQIVQCRPTLGLPILTGSSQGGEMTLLLSSTHPELVRSGVAVSSWILPAFWTEDMAPVRMIHGTGDDTVPFAWAKDYYEQLSARGAPLSFQSYSSPGHDVTKQMGNDWIASVRGEVEQLAGARAA